MTRLRVFLTLSLVTRSLGELCSQSQRLILVLRNFDLRIVIKYFEFRRVEHIVGVAWQWIIFTCGGTRITNQRIEKISV